jgi:hypothetical protein
MKKRCMQFLLLTLAVTVVCQSNRGAPKQSLEKEPLPSEADGHGTAIISPHDPVLVGTKGTWRLDFTVGEGGIPTGGGIVLQVSPWWRWSPPQTYDATHPGYTTMSTSAGGCELELTSNVERYYVIAYASQGALREGEVVSFIYGDTRNGRNPGAAASSDWYAERFQEFVFKTDGNGDGVYGEIEQSPGLELAPRNATQLWVTAPSLVAPGEPFEFSVAALDPIGNLATAYVGTLSVTAEAPTAMVPNVINLGREARGAGRFTVSISEPGLVVLEVKDEIRGLSASSNHILCGNSRLFRRVYWGDIHGHTALSDGTGHPDDYYRYARDAAGLDVAAVTDHAELGFRPLRGEPWSVIQESAISYNEPGRFVTLLGYEWTNWTYGHRNVYFPGDTASIFSAVDPGTTTPEGLWQTIAPWGAVTIPHHVGGGPVAIDWTSISPLRMEPLVEIYSVHGNCEFYGCPGMIYSAREGHFVQDALSQGRRLGIIASGDGHIGHPGRWTPDNHQGLVAFQARELTRGAIWECLTERRVYGTTGARILLQFTLNGYPMGSEIPDDELRGTRTGQIYVLGTVSLSSVEVIKNNQLFQQFSCSGIIGEYDFSDEAPWRSGDYYYIRVTQSDRHQAWSSPIWLGRSDSR